MLYKIWTGLAPFCYVVIWGIRMQGAAWEPPIRASFTHLFIHTHFPPKLLCRFASHLSSFNPSSSIHSSSSSYTLGSPRFRLGPWLHGPSGSNCGKVGVAGRWASASCCCHSGRTHPGGEGSGQVHHCWWPSCCCCCQVWAGVPYCHLWLVVVLLPLRLGVWAGKHAALMLLPQKAGVLPPQWQSLASIGHHHEALPHPLLLDQSWSVRTGREAVTHNAVLSSFIFLGLASRKA